MQRMKAREHLNAERQCKTRVQKKVAMLQVECLNVENKARERNFNEQ